MVSPLSFQRATLMVPMVRMMFLVIVSVHYNKHFLKTERNQRSEIVEDLSVENGTIQYSASWGNAAISKFIKNL